MTDTAVEIETVELFPDAGVGDRRVYRLPPFVKPKTPGGYVHLPRSAGIYTAEKHSWQIHDRMVIRFWCGSHRHITLEPGFSKRLGVWFTARRPPEMVCGTCDGRAEAYYDNASGTVFTPRNNFATPTWCPLTVWPVGDDCPLCGHRLRASPYPGYGPAKHKPYRSELSTDPCPIHGWPDMQTEADGMWCRAHDCGHAAEWGWRDE